MKKNNIYILTIIIIVCSIILFTIIYQSFSQDQSPKNIAEKTGKSIKYFEQKIFEIIIKLEKDEYLDDEKNLKWDDILNDCEKINIETDNIILDLSAKDISNEKIKNLSVYMNNVLISINQKNENSLINELNNLYQIIPEFLKENNNNNNNEVLKKELKAIVLNSFNNILKNDWESAKLDLENAESKYDTMITNNRIFGRKFI